ncbi:MAG TPA: hypothetical protein VFB90_07590 [Dehalococcoidia bacterium]|nr:hypothetical protein [Dehalococcoidia bacterium]
MDSHELGERFIKKLGEPPYYIDDVSVVFIDMVAFSSLRGSSGMQTVVEDMQAALWAILDPNYYWDETQKAKPNRIIVIPTGDGYAIAFHPRVDRREVLKRVDSIYIRLALENKLEIRIGVSRGPHIVFIDMNSNLNIIGEGIIRAQRAMMLAAPGQILCSGEFADGVQHEIQEGTLTALDGEWRVKNEKPFKLFVYTNLYGEKREKRRIGVDSQPDDQFKVVKAG